MPKRRQRKPKRNRNARKSDTVRIPFASRIASNLSGGLYSTNLAPATFPALGAVADVYQMYRFVNLSYRLQPCPTRTGSTAVVFIPGVTDTISGMTKANISQMRHHAYIGLQSTVPSSWARVPRSELSSYGVWLKSVIGTPNPDVEVQGLICVGGDATDNFELEIRGVIEFRDLVVGGVTPKMRFEHAMLLERERLLKVLNYQPTLKPQNDDSSRCLSSSSLRNTKT